MKTMGFVCIRCGKDGHEARAIALRWEAKYQDARLGVGRPGAYPHGTVGWAFEEMRGLEGWKRKPPGTREEWERGWGFIKDFFADVAPRNISLKLLDRWYYRILDEHGVDAAWRAMKIWRGLWGQMAGLSLCEADKDPSTKIRRLSQKPRYQFWTDGEIARLIKGAIRLRMPAVACIISIAWDTIFQPGDSRTLTRKELFRVGNDWVIDRGRLKNGTKVLGELKGRSRRLLECYLRQYASAFSPDGQIFRTRGYQPEAKGGRPRDPAPYTKNSLAKDFRDLRASVFGPDEKRTLMDLRRSGAMEAVAGDATAAQIGQAMGNHFEQSKKLQTTYAPNHRASVKKVDEARRRGRRAMGRADQRAKPLTFDWEDDSE